MTAGFFDMPESDVPRGPGGSPLLVPRGMLGTGVRVPYTRASSLASHIESSEHIHRWEMRYLAKGMGQNEDLAALAAVETYSTGLSDAVHGREKSASGRRLDDIIERALDRVRIHEKADYGTAVHGATEPGAPPAELLPERMRADVASFWDVIRREAIEIVATEQFTANDATMSAGTFDHLCRFLDPDLPGYVVCDKKTGKVNPHEWAIQISTYANGDPYNTADDTRPSWPGPINLDHGVVFHITGGKTTLYVIDLRAGWEAAQIAARARDYQARTDLLSSYWPPKPADRLAAATSTEDLRRLWDSTTDADFRNAIIEKQRSLG